LTDKIWASLAEDPQGRAQRATNGGVHPQWAWRGRKEIIPRPLKAAAISEKGRDTKPSGSKLGTANGGAKKTASVIGETTATVL